MCCSKTVSCLVRNLARQCDASRAAQGECISQVAQKRLEYAANGRYLPSCWWVFVWATFHSLSPYSLCLEGTHMRTMACWVLLGCAVLVRVRNGVPGKARVRYEVTSLLGLSICLWVLFACFLFVCRPPPPPFKAKHLSLPKTNTPYLLNSQCISSLALSILVSGALAQVISITIHSLPA